MECKLLTISLGLLLISSSILAEVSIVPNYDDKETMEVKYDIKKSINLNCKLVKTPQDAVTNVKWEKDEKELGSIESLKERLTFQDPVNLLYAIKITKATENDAGNYTCIVMDGKNEVVRAAISVISKYRVKTQNNLNFVEGENLRIPCQVYGQPYPIITWKIGNETYDEDTGRIQILKEDGGAKSVLFIKETEMGDRNTYECIGTPQGDDATIVSSKTTVRIKDKYAALWPFLGICAEVFILCAIILIYEKKRNKTELEESDTDQSPDQKNTPDHGKDSNLRHRQ